MDTADPAWDRCDWLDDLRNVPDGATWPRLMTSPHPSAVGSLGAEVATWADQMLDVRLRYWQRLVLARLLEVDADGAFVWLVTLLSTPRQVGKSLLLRVLALWRIHQGSRFGEEQTVMHISRGLSASREVQRAARVWARARKTDGYGAREQNGAQEVSTPDGSRWLIRDQDGVYSYSASLAVVDEAWGVEPAYVDEGLEPTLPERSHPQLVLVSTAHRRCTSLVLSRRAAALSRLAEPGNGLVLEWSAPGGDLSLGAARGCSPFWSRQRDRLAADALDRACSVGGDPAGGDDPAEAFRSQWLNVWPAAPAARAGAAEPLLAEDVWASLADVRVHPPARVVVALEDRTGAGCAGAASGRCSDGRVLVWGQSFSSRAAAAGWAELLGPAELLVGASMAGDEALAGLVVRKVGVSETGAALPKLRELALEGRLVHDGGAELAGQVAAARVVERAGGLGLSGSGRSDVLRCAAWAVVEAVRLPVLVEEPAIY